MVNYTFITSSIVVLPVSLVEYMTCTATTTFSSDLPREGPAAPRGTVDLLRVLFVPPVVEHPRRRPPSPSLHPQSAIGSNPATMLPWIAQTSGLLSARAFSLVDGRYDVRVALYANHHDWPQPSCSRQTDFTQTAALRRDRSSAPNSNGVPLSHIGTWGGPGTPMSP